MLRKLIETISSGPELRKTLTEQSASWMRVHVLITLNSMA